MNANVMHELSCKNLEHLHSALGLRFVSPASFGNGA
jgi:hypothetical protein